MAFASYVSREIVEMADVVAPADFDQRLACARRATTLFYRGESSRCTVNEDAICTEIS